MITMAEVNVRVAVRVRPLLPKEKLAGEEICLRIIPSAKQIVLGKDRGFTFDHVLPSTTSQDDVYKTCVEQLVKNIFDGYNATVFAYGQTGSGKTYTVGGNVTSQLEEEYGIIPRALKEIFSIIQNKKDVDFTIKVSYIEIYKEELQDLLDTETNKEMHVREDDKGNTVIIGAREAECETLDEVMMLLDAGSAARQTGATQMNEHSSRSHSIFTVVINQKWDDSDVLSEKRKKSSISEGCEIIDEGITHCMSGKFHFVDLAGSERVHRTGNVGDRFKESVHINSGLLALGNVISALGDPKKKNPHIPYRESKITRLLKDSLGGNSNTVMICCISPAISSFDETLNSLKYANRARNIKNKPIVNRDVQSIRFAELQSEIQFLREELVRQKTTIIANGIDNCDGDQAQDSSLMKELEEKVIKLQTECSHYQIVADEAYKHVKEILERNILSKSVDFRLRDWLDLMEEIKNRVPNTLSRESFENQTILDLTDQLEKCKKDLEEDESIFAQKDSEIRDRDQRIEELEIMLAERDKQLTDADEKTKQQEQQLIAQQMKIEELQKALKEALFNESSLDDDAVSASAPPAPVTGRRPKSVPAHIHKRPDTTGLGLRPMSRNIKTSPALFTLERVMKSFRARSQLLVSRLEDTDDVLHPTFNDDDDNQPQPPTDPQESSDGFTRFTRRGTFKIKKGRKDTDKENNANGGNVPEIEITKDETDISSSKTGSQIRGLQREETFIQKSMETKQQLNDAKHKMKESAQKLRDLSINIKLKEQLIRELVRSGKDADTMNKQYASKIDTLEKEKERVKSELTETQKQLQELEAKGQQESSEKMKLQQEFQKKIENAKARISTLQRKQKDTEKIANITGQNEKKIEDLNLAIDRMKQQQENLQKKLKEETERKAKLEREALKEAQRVKELELKNEQQQKLLKRKNEEIAAAQRKLRSGSLPPINMDDLEKIDEQKKWLDNEVERVVEQKRQVQDLKEDLKKREIILAKKEAILAEKSQLEMKKLRSSQVLDKSLVSLSSKLETIDRKLKEKNKELGASVEGNQSSIREEINKLSAARDQMQKKRETLEVKLHEGHLLSEQEERRLIEIDEAVDALDAAIEYKNDIINSRQHSIQHSNLLLQSEENVINRLNTLSAVETRSLLMKYFDKVISLREEERRKSFRCSEMEVKIDEQERLIHELEVTLERAKSDIDRRATKIQREYEEKIHLLMKQLNEASHSMGGGDSNSARVQQLEKELYYYKKTSRELKKRLRDYNVAVSASHGGDDNPLSSSLQSSVAESEVIEDLPSRILPHRERESHPGSIRHSSRPNSASQMSSNAAPKITPVKISRRDLRPVSENEVKLRRSNLTAGQSAGSQQLQDSLDLSAASQNNPWT